MITCNKCGFATTSCAEALAHWDNVCGKMVSPRCPTDPDAALVERQRIALALSSWRSDMEAAGKLCGQRDDEYPLAAVQRVVAERDAARAAIAAMREGQQFGSVPLTDEQRVAIFAVPTPASVGGDAVEVVARAVDHFIGDEVTAEVMAEDILGELRAIGWGPQS